MVTRPGTQPCLLRMVVTSSCSSASIVARSAVPLIISAVIRIPPKCKVYCDINVLVLAWRVVLQTIATLKIRRPGASCRLLFYFGQEQPFAPLRGKLAPAPCPVVAPAFHR
ncbi:exported hypothetical protein [uncultured Desulfovibrio sp.]|uniref:Uncharacterized protein n=1 Tax=uncultured Desulfovibrio sp. TaxID=167968 RepID=A0A212KYJ3_9BACT|nr:exported hypothetical protein [uncultured Desulfovibrio sp.]